MKTRNIITIISIITTLVLTSCSTEGDILSEMEGQNNPAETFVAAAVSCSINNGIATKTEASQEDANEAEQKINNVIFFLMKNDVVLGCKEDLATTIYTKNQDGMSVIAVVNASAETQTALRGAQTREAIKAQMLNVSDLDSLVKMGESEVTFSTAVEGAVAVEGAAAVEVSHIAARIELSTLSVVVKAADSKTVTVSSVGLVNRNANGRLNGEAQSLTQADVTTEINQSITEGAVMKNAATFYSFANNGENKTSLVLNFLVDGTPVSKTITIKHNSEGELVKAGYLYKLNVKITVMGENVTPEVTFTVAPWNKSNVSAGMEEVK